MNKLIKYLDKISKRKDKTDYCTASPDVIFGVDISSACKLHDKQWGQVHISKKESDKQFKRNIRILFDKKKKYLRGFIISSIYYYAVRLFGGKEWKN